MIRVFRIEEKYYAKGNEENLQLENNNNGDVLMKVFLTTIQNSQQSACLRTICTDPLEIPRQLQDQ